MSLIDIKAVKAAAQKELSEERTKRAADAIKKKLRDLDNARQIVRNIERDIADLEASIEDGSFA